MLAAFVFVLFVAACGSGLARLPWPDPSAVVVGPGPRLFPARDGRCCFRGRRACCDAGRDACGLLDARPPLIDLKMLAEHLSVEEDLLTDYVFENGFDVTQSQTVAAIDATVSVTEQREASTVVAATDAAMPLLRHCLGSTPHWRFCPLRAATCLVEAAPGSSGKCVCLPPGFGDEAWLHCRA